MYRTNLFLIGVLTSAATWAESDVLTAIEPDTFDRIFVTGSASCSGAFETLERPGRETNPKLRHQAAVTVRQCLEQDRSQEMAASKDVASLTYQTYSVGIERANARIAEESAAVDFRGIAFGVGVGVSFSGDDIIALADIDPDNVIRATKDESTQPRVILESHYYGWCTTDKCNEGRFGIGPYFGIVAKDDKLISAFSTGVMFGWKDSRKPSSAGVSVGVGAILDSDVQSLADGFEDGQPLPPGETQIRYKTESRWGAIIFFTRTF